MAYEHADSAASDPSAAVGLIDVGLDSRAPPGETPVPDGVRLIADASLERHDRGRLLVGGSPTRLMRLSEHGTRQLEAWLAGVPIRAETGRSDRLLARRLIDAAMLHPVPGSSPSPPLENVTAVVPVRDDPDGLAVVLSALAGEVRVVVVDDASARPRDTQAVASRFGAEFVKRSCNGGPAASRNTGLESVATEFVLFIDADAALCAQSLRQLLRHFDVGEVAACAPRVRSATAASDKRYRGDFNAELISDYERQSSPLDMGDAASPVGPDRRVRYVPAAALAVRVEAARRIGGFDESLRWGEDVDFVWRLVEGGYGVRFAPDVVAWHRPRATWGAWMSQRRSYGASAAALAQHHRGLMRPARCSKSAAAFWAMVALGWRLPATATSAATVLALRARLNAAIPEDRALAAGLATRLILRGHVAAARGLANALTRAWMPLMLVAALKSRRARRVLGVAVLAAAIADARRRWAMSRGDPGARGLLRVPRLVAHSGIRVVDDFCHCWGVWEGVSRQRCLDPLLLRLASSTPTRPPRRDLAAARALRVSRGGTVGS